MILLAILINSRHSFSNHSEKNKNLEIDYAYEFYNSAISNGKKGVLDVSLQEFEKSFEIFFNNEKYIAAYCVINETGLLLKDFGYYDEAFTLYKIALEGFLKYEEMTIGMVSGIISGIITSLIIYIYRMNIKPKIEISNKIVKRKDGRYQVKFINKSKHKCINIKMFIESLEYYNSGEYKNFKSSLVSITRKELYMVPGTKDRKLESQSNCILVSTYDNLETLMDEKKELRITIIAKLETSGVTTSFIKEYKDKSEVFHVGKKKFKSGETWLVNDDV